MLSVGFSGTRHGMTPQQKEAVRALLSLLAVDRETLELHHGLCVGSDEEAHDMVATDPRWTTVGWPASDVADRWRSSRECDQTMDPRPALERNEIIGTGHVLITTPRSAVRERSGTWSTVNRRATQTPCVVVAPTGELTWLS